MTDLHGKVAVVTGASRGIGRAIALRLAQDGARVVVNYAQQHDAAQATVTDIIDAGGEALAVQADITPRIAIRQLLDTTLQRYGRLDILVANAGYGVFKPLADGGRIVCISTIGTLLNMPGGACYFGAKAAVEQFCRVAAREVAARGITINVVSPGFTDTDMLRANLANSGPDASAQLIDMTPLARLGEGRDIAAVVAFLAGPDAAWMTRQNLAVDGGIVSR